MLPHPDLLSSAWSLEHRDAVKPLTETVSCLRGPSFGANTGALGICIVALFRKFYCVCFKHAYNVLGPNPAHQVLQSPCDFSLTTLCTLFFNPTESV